MTPLEHINVIEELVLNRASPAEIREHLLPVREALDAYAQLEVEHTRLQEAKSKADAEISQLRLRNLELKGSQQQKSSDSNWPTPGLHHDF